MPIRPKRADESEPVFDVDSVSRTPQQERSKASLGRMVVAARELMLERGSEDFTLQEVSQRGEVSIGSIYLRFESKENLVRAVIAQSLEAVTDEETEVIERLGRESTDLDSFVPAYVEVYAEVLRKHAPLLRLSMERAAVDPLVSGPGKSHAIAAERKSVEAMLVHKEEIKGRDQRLKAQSAYHVIFATLARHLSLGSTDEAASGYDWGVLKRELGRMCLAYLKAD